MIQGLLDVVLALDCKEFEIKNKTLYIPSADIPSNVIMEKRQGLYQLSQPSYGTKVLGSLSTIMDTIG